MNSKKIFVTKTFLPPLKKYQRYLEKIWKTNKLTNQGPILKKFEEKLRNYLKVKYLHFLTNGTLALQIALRALNINEGEIITTPFTYVATVSSILWERCTPVFVDINPETLCIDADKIEKAITKKTKAILPVHVFGIPCDVKKIAEIAKNYHLKIIYDAAHAFGVEYKEKNIFNFGDISMGSFHATKIFHTIEGGCLTTNNKEISDKIELIKRFGHNQNNHYMLGINAKASEFQAAMGLCNLEYIEKLIEKRKKLYEMYNQLLGDSFQKPKIPKSTKYNFSYYPIIFKNENQLLKAVKILNKNNIYPRRYFYPSLNTLPYLKNSQKCSVSEDISKRILCLPFYEGIWKKDLIKIVKVLMKQI
ncbi:MAG: DegT/DnrJ/EryC1/StrS family aminotransferase [Microgenomates group bacterium]|nr:DegT/DnrJ/EryC1/StrS family aminotransferase [Microgenomates group bacterium]